MSYKLGIVGSRVFTTKGGRIWNTKIKNPKQYVFDHMNKYIKKHGKPSLVVSGGAKGADQYGVEWARSKNIPVKEYIPDQRLAKITNFRTAALTRNTDIVNSSDHIVAFWDKKSTGTLNTLSKAKKAKKKVSYFNIGNK